MSLTSSVGYETKVKKVKPLKNLSFYWYVVFRKSRNFSLRVNNVVIDLTIRDSSLKSCLSFITIHSVDEKRN